MLRQGILPEDYDDFQQYSFLLFKQPKYDFTSGII